MYLPGIHGHGIHETETASLSSSWLFAEPWPSTGSSPPQEKKLVNKHLIGSTRWYKWFSRSSQALQYFVHLQATSKQQLSTNWKFHIPDLKVNRRFPPNLVSTKIIGHILLIQVGTLDQLVGLSDDLGKLDVFVEQVTRFSENSPKLIIWWPWEQMRRTRPSSPNFTEPPKVSHPLFHRKVSNYLGDVLEEQRDKVFYLNFISSEGALIAIAPYA